MTDKNMQHLAAGLNEAGKANFAQPQQAAVLRAILLDHKVEPSKAVEICTAMGPFFNASAMLQTLKKMGTITSELTAAQRAQADALTRALKA